MYFHNRNADVTQVRTEQLRLDLKRSCVIFILPPFLYYGLIYLLVLRVFFRIPSFLAKRRQRVGQCLKMKLPIVKHA